MSLNQLKKTDLLLINRGPQSYKFTVSDFSKELGLDLDTGNIIIDGDLTVSGNGIIGDPNDICGGKTLTIYNETVIHCALEVKKPATLKETLVVEGTTTLKANTSVAGALAVTQDVFATDGVKSAIGVLNNSLVLNPVGVGNNSVLASTYPGKPWVFGNTDTAKNPVEIEGTSGNAYFKGEVHGSHFVGDGSRLINLNLPGSLVFLGVVDLRTATAPSTPVIGEYYLNASGDAADPATGTVNAGWTGIEGTSCTEGDFVYFAEDPSGDKWVKASGNDTAYVTLAGAQTISGAKGFTQSIRAFGGVDATGQTVLAKDVNFTDATGTKLTLTGKAISDSTIDTDSGTTLTTKDYVDNASQNAKTKHDLVAGDHLIDVNGDPGAIFNGSAEVTLNVDADTAPTPSKIVLRDASGNISGVDVNATGGNLNVTNGSIQVITPAGTSTGAGKITCTNDITTLTSVISAKVVTDEVEATTYNIHNLTAITSLAP